MLSTPATLSSSNNSDSYVNMAAPFMSSKAKVCVCVCAVLYIFKLICFQGQTCFNTLHVVIVLVLSCTNYSAMQYAGLG